MKSIEKGQDNANAEKTEAAKGPVKPEDGPKDVKQLASDMKAIEKGAIEKAEVMNSFSNGLKDAAKSYTPPIRKNDSNQSQDKPATSLNNQTTIQ